MPIYRSIITENKNTVDEQNHFFYQLTGSS